MNSMFSMRSRVLPGAQRSVLRRVTVVVLVVALQIRPACMGEPQRGQLLLDLTVPSVQRQETQLTFGCGGGSLVGTGHGVVLPPALPLALHVAPLNIRTYRSGDQLTALLILTNEGNAPIKIPMSVNAGLIFGSDCKWLPGQGVVGLHGRITLVLNEVSGQRYLTVAHALYGVSSDPSTYYGLAPGGERADQDRWKCATSRHCNPQEGNRGPAGCSTYGHGNLHTRRQPWVWEVQAGCVR